MRKRRSKVINLAIPGGTAPAAYPVPLQTADRVSAHIEGWLSNGFVGNVHLFEASLDAASCANRLGRAGQIDMLMTLTDGAISKVPMPEETHIITVYVDTVAPGAGVEVVTLLVSEEVPTESDRHKGL